MLLQKKKSNLNVLREDFLNEAKKAHKIAKKRVSHFMKQAGTHPKVVNIKHSVQERPVSSGVTLVGISMALIGIAGLLLKK